jgi:hypothetical protein
MNKNVWLSFFLGMMFMAAINVAMQYTSNMQVYLHIIQNGIKNMPWLPWIILAILAISIVNSLASSSKSNH